MEIIFDKVSYLDKKLKNSKVLEDLSFSIKKGSINGFIYDYCYLTELLCLNKKPNSGSINVNNVSIKKNTKVDDYSIIKNKIGVVDYSDDYLFSERTVLDYICNEMKKHNFLENDTKKRVADSLRLVGLNDSFIGKNPNNLSYTEQKKIIFASVLSYNPDIIVLDNFDKGLSFRDKESYKKLFNKLKIKLNKTIVIITKDISYLFDCVDNFYIINNSNLVYNGSSKSFYDDEIYKYIEMPKIIEFTKYANSMDKNILEYTDFKELIKEIYRKV